MGNSSSSSNKPKPLPIDTIFKLPSPIPTWPKGEGFGSGTIDVGGLLVQQISSFTKIWATHKGGPSDLGATFFEPSSIPDGFSLFGCYAQPNDRALSGWVLVGKDESNDESSPILINPIDYALVWSSESSRVKQREGHGYIWSPIAPVGYRAIGHVVTTSPEKPPLDRVRCVRSDLTEECGAHKWIWAEGEEENSDGFNIYGSKPTNVGKQALGVSVGTFVALIKSGTNSSNNSTPLALSCLKNNKFDPSSSMPNLAQIEALVQAYSPLIYFHPKETYLPSSVDWYFNSGVLLHTRGEVGSTHVPVDPNGSNLPQGGSNDGSYWLDLPMDEEARERVKRGNLQSCEAYIHVKPMFGATFTDLATWVFYPFNGPGTARVLFADIPLGRIGEHIGDWEHLTIRVSNFNGELQGVYLSQHSRGVWVDPSFLGFERGNKPVAYSSLHGHAFYPRPGVVMQGNPGVGIKNECGRSNMVVDTGERYKVVSAETVVEPPWLNYARKWGPNVTYEIGVEVEKVEGALPEGLKAGFQSLVDVLPNEVFGEDGPTGPKGKNSWEGDEPQVDDKVHYMSMW